MRTGLLLLVCAVVFGQAPVLGQAPGGPTFEVASVKPSAPVAPNARVYFGPPRGGPGTPDPAQISWSYATMKSLVMTAYDVKAYQISGPDWMTSERYDIVAKVPEGATNERVGLMWQNLLAERFGVVLHREPREFRVEELVVAKGGTKLKETEQDLTAPLPEGPPELKDGKLLSPGVVVRIYPGVRAHAVGRAQPISQLTAMLGNQLNRPVIDKTGLTGRYDFTIDYSVSGMQGAAPAMPPGDGAGDPGPDLAAAVEQQLGLRLVGSRAKIDVLVIDKVEKAPTQN